MSMNSTSKPTECCSCGNLHVHGAVFQDTETHTGLDSGLVSRVHQSGKPLFQLRKGCLTVRHPGFLRSSRLSGDHYEVRCALCGSSIEVYFGRGLASAQFKEIQTHKRRHSDTDFRNLPRILADLIAVDYSTEECGETTEQLEEGDEVVESDFELMFSHSAAVFVGSPYEPAIYGLAL
jgi:hypothetical protein